MLLLRKIMALGGLAGLGGLVLSAPGPGYVSQGDLRVVLFPLLAPGALTLIGIVVGWAWSRWLGLAVAIAVLPWGVALLFDSWGPPGARVWIVVVSALLILIGLTGRTAFEGFEGRSGGGASWRGRRMAIVRWTLILSLAAVLNLYLFATAYAPAAAWHSVIPGGLALGLTAGAWLLARQRTLGLLVLAASCLLLPPALLYFVLHQPVSGAERALFAALFFPAWLAAVVATASFAGPMRRYARD